MQELCIEFPWPYARDLATQLAPLSQLQLLRLRLCQSEDSEETRRTVWNNVRALPLRHGVIITSGGPTSAAAHECRTAAAEKMREPSTPRSQATEEDMTNLKAYQTSAQAMKMMLATQEQHAGVVKKAQERAGWMFSAQAHCRAAPPMYMCTNPSAQPFYPGPNHAAAPAAAQRPTGHRVTQLQQQPLPAPRPGVPARPPALPHPPATVGTGQSPSDNFSAQDPIVAPRPFSPRPAAVGAWTQPFLHRLQNPPPPLPPRGPLQPQAAAQTATEFPPLCHAHHAAAPLHGGAQTADTTASSNPFMHNHEARMGQILSADWSYQPVEQARQQHRRCQLPLHGDQPNDTLTTDACGKLAAETATRSAEAALSDDVDDASTRYRVSVEAPAEWFKGRSKGSTAGSVAHSPKFKFNAGHLHASPERFCNKSFSNPGGSPGAALTYIHASRVVLSMQLCLQWQLWLIPLWSGRP